MTDYELIEVAPFDSPPGDIPVLSLTYDLPPRGNGYLAGEFPDGITRIDGVPSQATVRVLYRPQSGARGDGVVVAEVQSNPDGTWRVDGLNTALKYDVVGRKDGFNDVIMANVAPAVD